MSLRFQCFPSLKLKQNQELYWKYVGLQYPQGSHLWHNTLMIYISSHLIRQTCLHINTLDFTSVCLVIVLCKRSACTLHPPREKRVYMQKIVFHDRRSNWVWPMWSDPENQRALKVLSRGARKIPSMIIPSFSNPWKEVPREPESLHWRPDLSTLLNHSLKSYRSTVNPKLRWVSPSVW